ncbi:GDSL-type esterase/lipase family protein [Nocardia otitidiscaviarum]|uniref:GDSL-type esterase/lipase family protein n=1 Tax=Nocardia otitidiscaviarum TaxID=1823 RepID=UPI0004A6D5FF|nr:GDSL-type esterase/lipase family protein [Nocardia otitidiscaviarum]
MTSTDTTAVTGRIRDEHGDAVRIGIDCDIAADVDFVLDPGATITLGDRVSIRRGTTLQANAGGRIEIGDDVAIGENVVMSAMNYIGIGRGVGISNMVDIHDHNHLPRTEATPATPITPWASGFEVAPITIEAGAIVSAHVSVTAGVTIGQNARIGANAVVAASVPPNSTAVGAPARVIGRTPGGVLDPGQPRTRLRVAWFGTSLMEHYEAHNPRLSVQADLPAIGEKIEVTEWRTRGYVHGLLTTWRARYPWITFDSDNRGEGGATSRDVLAAIRAATEDPQQRWDLAVLGAGINDVWRTHQHRLSEAVDIEEFDSNIGVALEILATRARRVVVIGEPPMGWEPGITVAAANADIAAYNERARRSAEGHGAHFVDVWEEIMFAATCLGWSPADPAQPPTGTPSIWSDGVHLSEYGDEVLRAVVDRYLGEHRIVAGLLTADRLPREVAADAYRA